MNMLRLVAALIVASVVNGCATDPIGRFTFSVKDDEGAVVPNLKICLAGHKRWVPGHDFGRDEFRNIEGATDANGMLTLEIASDQGAFAYAVQRTDMYYPYYARDIDLSKKEKDRWLPWEKKIDIVLKKKGTSVVMYAKITGNDERSTMPKNDVEIGYDLMAGDWTSPDGEGHVADFYVKFEHDVKSKEEYLHTMTLRFPNEGDGVIPYPVPLRERDEIVLPRMAPENGYSQIYVEKTGREKGGYVANTTENDNFILRTRTIIQDGKVVSAHYGKIRDKIAGASCNTLLMRYYLNPNPNDRNLEVDWHDNLIKHLTESQTPVRYKSYKDYAR